ncbi:MAG: hypothetical protein CFE41_21590 [Burkholderiales bacterium PBB2]|nr:MAG: hypothetical protein CFE41_21590 [Burkholderiales bacterium PBB2]
MRRAGPAAQGSPGQRPGASLWHALLAALWLVLWAAAGPVRAQAAQVAQVAPGMVLAASPIDRCLEPSAALRGQPAYPEREYLGDVGAELTVLLRFSAPDQPPAVTVERSEARQGTSPDAPTTNARPFVDAVKAHVQAWRLPCLRPADGVIEYRVSYRYVPRGSRQAVWTASGIPGAERAGQGLRCLVHQPDGRGPRYPEKALRKAQQGVVMLRMRFVSVDKPPEISALAYPEASPLRDAAEDWADGYRMPCLDPGAPVDTVMTYVFKIADAPRTVLKDLDLMALLRSSQALPPGAQFDTHTMGCPFDLKIMHLQPHELNKVGQLDTPNPARVPLLQWLQFVQLRAPNAQTANQLLGQSHIVHVPCAQVDLR